MTRRLIAVDVENLLGVEPALASDACWDAAVQGLVTQLDIRAGTDHVVIAADPQWAFYAGKRMPTARLEVRSGASGADLALCDALCDTAFLTQRYTEIVIASGDHIFTASVHTLVASGLHVTVAAIPIHASPELTAAADAVVWLRRPGAVLGELATIAVADGMQSVAGGIRALALAA